MAGCAERRHPEPVRLAAIALLFVVGCSEGVADVRAAPRTEASRAPTEAAEPEPATEAATIEVVEAVEVLEPTPDAVAALLALEGSLSTSIGGPNDGSIRGAVALPESGPGFRSNGHRPNTTAVYGSVEMVQAIVRAAAVVDEEMPGSVLFINDLGFEEGGPIARHASHQAGRDIDVLFYLLDEDGEPREPIGAFLDPRGRGVDFKDLENPDDDVDVQMDVPRTWRFVQALLEGPNTNHVQRIFVAEHLRTLMVEHARRSRAPRAALERFEQISCQPGYPHDDHLHIRFHCTPEDMAEGCEDSGPVYPWRRDELRALGLQPVIHRPRRRRARAPRTTAADARAAAGPMHARVTEWLDRREAWLQPPRTGRDFCR